INEGGAEAMFHDLRRMDLGDCHPRDIPEALLTNPALQKQQALTLPLLEQWYVLLLHDGVLPHALEKRPNTTLTRNLIEDIKERVPKLKGAVSEPSLATSPLDNDNIGIICKKSRASHANGWPFPPFCDCRQAWQRRYGPTSWDNPAEEWSKRGQK